MIPNDFQPIHRNNFDAIKWRDLIVIPPYHFLRIPEISWKDEFTAFFGKLNNHLRQKSINAVFSHNARTTYSTVYDEIESISFSWISRNVAGLMLRKRKGEPNTDALYDITNDYAKVSSVEYGQEIVYGTYNTRVNIETNDGIDLSCLVLGTTFEPDYSGFRYFQYGIEFTKCVITKDGRSFEIGQDEEGNFWNKTDRKRLELFDNRVCGLVYNK